MDLVNHSSFYDPAAMVSSQDSLSRCLGGTARARYVPRGTQRNRIESSYHPALDGTRCRWHDQPRRAKGSSVGQPSAAIERHSGLATLARVYIAAADGGAEHSAIAPVRQSRS